MLVPVFSFFLGNVVTTVSLLVEPHMIPGFKTDWSRNKLPHSSMFVRPQATRKSDAVVT